MEPSAVERPVPDTAVTTTVDAATVDADRQRPASVRIQRRVEWAQTDAAGHHHWSAVLHWAEQAQTVLHERLGIAHRTHGREPRVHMSVDLTERVYFRDLVEIELVVRSVGTSSVRYGFTVTRADDAAAAGELVAVHVDPDSGRAHPWPEDVRAALTGGGEQLPELLAAGPRQGRVGRAAHAPDRPCG